MRLLFLGVFAISLIDYQQFLKILIKIRKFVKILIFIRRLGALELRLLFLLLGIFYHLIPSERLGRLGL